MADLKKTQKQHQDEYISRINKAIDYIEQNLNNELSLNTVAEKANFSPFHFHRLFGSIIGETLNQFINRLRLEKAASQLLNNPKKMITEIAFDCGFSGSATFARAFKNMFGISATNWRDNGYKKNSKICKTENKISQSRNKIWKESTISAMYIDPVNNNLNWRINMLDKANIQIEVKDVPERHIAYVRHIGPYKGDYNLFENMFNKLSKWAAPRDLLQFPKTEMMCIYYDDPGITAEDKLRVDACITISPETPVDGSIGKATVPGGKFAVAHFEIDSDEYESAWKVIYGDWLPQSGFQPDDRPCYELYLNNPKEHPENKHIVDIYVPVKPL
ncbi:MAG: helix-turn-helix domain-containing protein [Calditrichaeota bacterium]|nr:MAG: helix-turn-helix domain-containing protein [Calditrichota bacterium]MBL1205293.1 helix-turn-helix domain-containing protein [Calditrichota bacterium]NOG45122.1 AraC family transcriptional regulator [Calditrichota bacterium]